MSQKIDLEFVHTPFFSFTRFSWIGLLILATSLVASVITWQVYQSMQIDFLGLESKLYQLNQLHLKKLPAKQVSKTIPIEKLKQFQEAVSTLTTPWSELFEAIEQSDKQDIALLGLEPNSQKQQVVIRGEAKNLQEVLEFIEQLEKQPVLAQVFLQKHSIDEANTSKPVSFTVYAKWKMI